jgi:hypothetical protein
MEREELEKIFGKVNLTAIDNLGNKQKSDVDRRSAAIAERSVFTAMKRLGLEETASRFREFNRLERPYPVENPDLELDGEYKRKLEESFESLRKGIDGAPGEKIEKLIAGIDALLQHVNESYEDPNRDNKVHHTIRHRFKWKYAGVFQTIKNTRHARLVPY